MTAGAGGTGTLLLGTSYLARALAALPAIAAIGLSSLTYAQARSAQEEEQAEARRAPTEEVEELVVVAPTPVQSLPLPEWKIPSNVQQLVAEDLARENPQGLVDVLARRVASVDINASQNNPHQHDLNYRGLLASSILGSPVGLSLYLDGMRLNETFGDTINWDLIPTLALSEVWLMPGSNPLFGRNTLGGALALATKNGFGFQGSEVRAYWGSFAGRGIGLEHGNHTDRLGWYFWFDLQEEDGWRDESPSDLGKGFGKVSWMADGLQLHLSYLYARAKLVGNGFAPESLLRQERDAVYTFPDRTDNDARLVNLQAVYDMGDFQWVASGFFRHRERDTSNGDAELECEDELSGEELVIHPELCEAAGGELDMAGEDRVTRTDSESWGVTIQLARKTPLWGHGNQLIAGVSFEHSRDRFVQRGAEAELFASGHSHGTRRLVPFQTEVDVHSEQRHLSLYLTNTFDLTERLALTFSTRYTNSRIALRDRSGIPENARVRGSHGFRRLNPAIGLSYKTRKWLTLFGGYSQGFRTPTPAELTCADEDAPCNLPNAFVSDPPLDPVRAETWELGARGALPLGDASRWAASFFRTNLRDDLLFTQTGVSGAGFFRNVEETRRQGFELNLLSRWGELDFYLGYGLVDATYETHARLASVVDPKGTFVKPGDRIPGIARHQLKLGLDWSILENRSLVERWSIGFDVNYASGGFLRGDDGNVLSKTSGYGSLALNTRLQLGGRLELWVEIENLFDRKYETSGIRNLNAFDPPEFGEERFLAPGAPRSIRVGVRGHLP